MPFKSKRQARKLHAMAKRGEISKSKVREWDKATDFANLPETAPKKKKKAGRKRR